jgi:hypothetical protein
MWIQLMPPPPPRQYCGISLSGILFPLFLMRCMYVGRPVACRLSVVTEARTAKVVSVELTHPDKDCDCGSEVECPCERFIPV